MSYAIICDARKGESLGIHTLMLVDRTKTKKLWWTSDNEFLGIAYRKKSAAEFAANRLRMNNARVVTWEFAVKLIRDQAFEIIHKEAMDDADQSWDAHKDWL